MLSVASAEVTPSCVATDFLRLSGCQLEGLVREAETAAVTCPAPQLGAVPSRDCWPQCSHVVSWAHDPGAAGLPPSLRLPEKG